MIVLATLVKRRESAPDLKLLVNRSRNCLSVGLQSVQACTAGPALRPDSWMTQEAADEDEDDDGDGGEEKISDT